MIAAMTTLSILASSFLIALFSGIAFQSEGHSPDVAEQAISPDQNVAAKAQDQLRLTGPQGLELLEQRFAKDIAGHRSGAPSDARWKRISAALDRVGGQYDDYSSGLYWYTDLEKARAAARASGRPILSLRLLGRLDEDLSCANSRFFRTTLYPNAEISRLLKDRFILHWESVRPAPRITIDFGDGRKLERTITGNSIHYILDADGKVVDALPGLYSAAVFTTELKQTLSAAKQTPPDGTSSYTRHMKTTQARLLNAWVTDLATIKVVQLPGGIPTEHELDKLTDNQMWKQMARLHASEVRFDSDVRELMARKFPDARTVAPLAVSKSAIEVPMLRAFPTLTNSIALDTVRNNYMLRTRILAYLADSETQSLSLHQINDWVYAVVFLTPKDDPWLGLAPPNVFAALDGNGQSQ
jgi:hypothetical protein